MLEELRIRGLGVIDDAVLPLRPGLTVVTGETGAGKTMVITGLLLLFGGRGDAARVRAGAAAAVVDGRLELAAASAAAQRVRDAGGELDDGTGLALRRTVSASGRSRAHVGGAPAPVAVLADLADHLLTVHGQSDQLRLTKPAEQRTLLDRFAGIDLAPFAAAYEQWRSAAAELADRTARAGELRREAELLANGLAEIEAAAPRPGEDEEIARAAARLGAADALRSAARAAHDALLGSPDDPIGGTDAVTLLGGADRALRQVAGADPELDQLGARAADLVAEVGDLGADLRTYTDRLDADPDRLEQVQRRRAVLTALVRKYGDDPERGVAGVLDWAREAASRLASLDVSDEALAALEARRDAAAKRVANLASKLSQQRRAAARALAAAVTAELGGLAMARARLLVEVRPRAPVGGQAALDVAGEFRGIGPDGSDDVDLLLSPAPGTIPLPLGRGASGGELSRVMLALEVCLAGTDPVPLLVFDEVDAGVGGRAAVEVGRRLARLAGTHQVLVVTHLPQVAAYADHHLVVDRPEDGDTRVTSSNVRVVAGAERVAELARMLAGSESSTALRHAAELLDAAAADRGAAAPA
jgi:DNA repair protein RecN (Recombination protein N)